MKLLIVVGSPPQHFNTRSRRSCERKQKFNNFYHSPVFSDCVHSYCHCSRTSNMDYPNLIPSDPAAFLSIPSLLPPTAHAHSSPPKSTQDLNTLLRAASSTPLPEPDGDEQEELHSLLHSAYPLGRHPTPFLDILRAFSDVVDDDCDSTDDKRRLRAAREPEQDMILLEIVKGWIGGIWAQAKQVVQRDRQCLSEHDG